MWIYVNRLWTMYWWYHSSCNWLLFIFGHYQLYIGHHRWRQSLCWLCLWSYWRYRKPFRPRLVLLISNYLWIYHTFQNKLSNLQYLFERKRHCNYIPIFEITRTIYSNSESSVQFLKQNAFLTCSWRFLKSDTVELGFRSLQKKLEKKLSWISTNSRKD